jgi:hypothetical protein
MNVGKTFLLKPNAKLSYPERVITLPITEIFGAVEYSAVAPKALIDQRITALQYCRFPLECTLD